jgi:hypothetical protein
MFYHSGVIMAPNLNTFTGHRSDKKSSLEKIPSTASLRRNAARLRKVRWTIYKKIRFSEKNLGRSLGYYKNLVKRFLKRFSVKLKPKEIAIWQEKFVKTSKDVEDFLSKKRKSHSSFRANILMRLESNYKLGEVHNVSSKFKKDKNAFDVHVLDTAKKASIVKKVNKAKPCDNCTMSNYVVNLDAVMVLLFTLLNLVKVDPDKNHQYKPVFSKTPVTEQIFDDVIDTTAQVCDTSGNKVRVDDCVEEIDSTDDIHTLAVRDLNLDPVELFIPKLVINDDLSKASITEQIFDDEIDATVQVVKPSEAKDTSDSTETPEAQKPAWKEFKEENCLLIKEQALVRHKFCYYRKWMKVTEDREKTFYEPADMVGLHEETVITDNVEEIVEVPTKPVDKNSDEYKRRLKEASNRFLAASEKLGKICPLNIHSGYAIYDCRCEVKVRQSRCPHTR